MFNLNALALFVQVVDAGSFAAAGRSLGLPANTLSRRIQQLEAELGQRLLQRSTRKLGLSAAGQALYDQSAPQLARIYSAQQSLSSTGQEPTGLLRIAAPADLFEHVAMAWVAEFLGRYPKLQLEFRLSDAKADLIAEGIDVALRTGEMLEPGLVARKLANEQLVLVANPDYLQTHAPPIRLAELAQHDCLARAGSRPARLWGLDGPHGMEEVEVGGRFYANSAQSLLRAARCGLGIALLPLTVVQADLAIGNLLRVLPDYSHAIGGIYAVYPSRHGIAPGARLWVEFVLEKMGAQFGR